MAVLRPLDPPAFARVDRIVRILSLVIVAVAGAVLVGSWRGRFADGTGSAAVLVAMLWNVGWISVRARLDPARAGHHRSTADDGYRGPLAPPRSRKAP